MPAKRRDDLKKGAGLVEQSEMEFSRLAIQRRRLRRSEALAWSLWSRILGGAKRTADLVIGIVLLFVFSPLLLVLHLVNARHGGAVLSSPRIGRWGRAFHAYSFSSGWARNLPALFNVVRGDMSLIGPRALAPGQVNPSEPLTWKRFDARPGFLCLWWIRSRANIAYGTETKADAEYVETQSFLGDLGIALRAIPAFFYSDGEAFAPERISLLGIPIENCTMHEALEKILSRALGAAASQVCFVNADCVNIACRDPEYREILLGCGLVLADGIGVKLAGKILNRRIRQNVNGTDLLPLLCEAAAKQNLSIYLLGGKPGVAAAVAQWMEKNFTGLRLGGSRHGYFSVPEQPEVLEQIRASGAEILLVAFGAPRQEKWVREHLHATGAKVAMGVGGLFDFYSGRIPRAPVWIREIGMEWFYRFCQEPRRMWRRYFVGNLIFLSRIVRDRLRAGPV